jgi:hypothetical protein
MSLSRVQPLGLICTEYLAASVIDEASRVFDKYCDGEFSLVALLTNLEYAVDDTCLSLQNQFL